jgi:uncharacterized protein (DUF58 family)
VATLLPPHAPLTLKARPLRKKTGGARAGAHVATARGRGLVFDEVRAYVPGDDPRRLDGNVTARSGVPHIKVFSEEKERPIHLVVDLGPGTLAGFPDSPLATTIAQGAAMLGKAAFSDGDRVTLHLLRRSPAAPRRFHKLQRLLDALALALRTPELPAEREATFAHENGLFRRFTSWLRRRSAGTPEQALTPEPLTLAHHLFRVRRSVRRGETVFVFSPFFGDEDWLQPLSLLASSADLLVFPAFQRGEKAAPALDVHALRDVLTGERVVLDGADRALRERTIAREEFRQEAVLAALRSRGVPTIPLPADDGPEEVLRRHFSKRGR